MAEGPGPGGPDDQGTGPAGPASTGAGGGDQSRLHGPPMVMGVLNVTPDSFSDGGLWLGPDAAVEHGLEMVAEGAQVVDVGGESTRPGADPVDEATELRRVLPVIEGLAPHVRVSIDTRKEGVARAAIAAGATLVNDVSASLWGVAAEGGVGWVAMHMQGEPATMQHAPRYGDVVGEVCRYLEERAELAEAAGVGEVWLDPGFGFGKDLEHNLALLAHLDRVVALGRPVLVGLSRKATLGRLLAASDLAALGRDHPGTEPLASQEIPPVPVDDRLEASIATQVWAMRKGARMVRAHDVRAASQAARVVGE